MISIVVKEQNQIKLLNQLTSNIEDLYYKDRGYGLDVYKAFIIIKEYYFRRIIQ